MGSYRVRTMQAGDVALALEWAAAEGWNPGLHDAGAFFAADPEGFLIGEIDRMPAATMSAVRYGKGFAFVGCYIVAPAVRGRGYGIGIWREAMRQVEGRTVGLDGVVAQQDNYRKSGFVLDHRNVRYEGIGGPASDTAPGIVPLGQAPWAELLAYDTAHFGCSRPNFLHAWCALPESQGWAVVGSGGLQGYGVVRRCLRGCKIGPLFADTEAVAEVLFTALAGFAPGQPLFLDSPEPNVRATALAHRMGMTPVFETARMYAGSAPVLPLDRIYGITSFELG